MRFSFKANDVAVNEWNASIKSGHFEGLRPGTLSGDNELHFPNRFKGGIKGQFGVAVGIGDAIAEKGLAIEQTDTEVFEWLVETADVDGSSGGTNCDALFV